MDNLVFDVDLRLLFCPLDLELLDVGALLLKHRVLILNPAVVNLQILTHISELVLSELNFTLRRRGHLQHFVLVVLLPLLDDSDLIVCILCDLVHSFLIVAFHGFNVLLEQVDELFLFANGVGMILVLLIDLLGVLLVNGSLGIAEFPLLLQLLLLQGLIFCGILEHILRVLVAASFHLGLILILLHLELLIKLVFNFLPGAFHLINLRPDVMLKVSLSSLHLLDHLLLLIG